MRDPQQVCHIAIPCADLDVTANFYSQKMGLDIARRYDDRVTINFFGDQLVCHLCPEMVDEDPKMYPRHFGITFSDKSKFEKVLAQAKANQVPFFKDMFVRFQGRREEHMTFFLIDPANNLIEFKYYLDPEMMY